MQTFLYLYVTDSLCQFFWRITFCITATAQSIAHPFSSALMNVSARQDSESAVKNRGDDVCLFPSKKQGDGHH